VIRVYHGGLLDQSAGSLWATPDSEYAAAFAQLHDGALSMLTLDVAEDEVLDLRGCGLDATAAATDLRFAGISVKVDTSDVRSPHLLLRRIPAEAIRSAASLGFVTRPLNEIPDRQLRDFFPSGGKLSHRRRSAPGRSGR
jgi:hypothetical protein